MTVRLGAVGFLNARPLVAALESNPVFSVTYSSPSACATRLREERIDVGLIPAIEYALNPQDYFIVPQVSIASREEVLTVRLFHTISPEQIARVALDTSSLTSVALVKILLSALFDAEPEFVDEPPDLERMLERADAALLIGDSVFSVLDVSIESIDLGRAWRDFTGLPFVFAFWAGRSGSLSPREASELVQAARTGNALIPQLASTFAARHSAAVSSAVYERYLRDNICFELGEQEIEGLYLFYSQAQARGLIEAVPELRFFELG